MMQNAVTRTASDFQSAANEARTYSAAPSTKKMKYVVLSPSLSEDDQAHEARTDGSRGGEQAGIVLQVRIAHGRVAGERAAERLLQHG